MKNAIVKLGFIVIFFCAGHTALAVDPFVTVTRQGPAITNTSTVDFNVHFDQSVTGLGEAADFMISGGGGGATAAVQSGSGQDYVVRVSGYTEGLINLTIKADAAENAGGDGNVASIGPVPSFTYDITKPTVTIVKKPAPSAQADPTFTNPIKFRATFNEDINLATFDNTDIDMSTSTATGGTITVSASFTQVVANREYDIDVTVSGTPVTGQVIARILVDRVADVAGNLNTASSGGDNSVEWQTKPVLGANTVTDRDLTQARIGASITSDGGESLNDRGVYWDNDNTWGAGDTKESMTGSPFNEVINLGAGNEATQFWFKSYAVNDVGETLSAETTFWTLAEQPDGTGLTVTPGVAATGTGSIHITFPEADDRTDAVGYVILRKAGSEPLPSDLPDGTHPLDLGGVGAMRPSGAEIIAILGDNVDEYDDNDPDLDPCVTYYYAAVLFNWRNDHSTTNYRYGGCSGSCFLFASAATWCSESDISINNTAASTLDFTSEIGASVTGTSDGLTILSLRLRDGGSDGADTDSRHTELATITISIDHPEFLNAVAYVHGSYFESKPAAASMTWMLPNGTTVDNDGSPANDTNFSFRAVFKASPIIDQTPIVVSVTGATTRSNSGAGSDFATANAGGVFSGASNNKVDVIATEFVYSGFPATTSPTTPFSLTVTAQDAAGNVDTNRPGTVTLTLQSGSPDLTAVGGLARTLTTVNGVATFGDLVFSTAQAKVIRATHSGNAPTAQIPHKDLPLECISPGCIVVGPTQSFCFNNGSGGFALLNAPIQITEFDGSDFGTGQDQTFSVILPDGFVFDTGATPTFAGSGGDDVDLSDVEFAGYTGNNVVRIRYDVDGQTTGASAVKDKLVVNNLRVKYIGTAPVSNQQILRIGGNAAQAGNSETDGEVHGLLSANSNPLIEVDFENATGQAQQTSFSKSITTPIELRGLKTNVPTGTLAGATAVFSGNGVSLDGGVYKFIPSAVSNGNHDITFTYTDPVAPGCISTATKTYTVFSSIINGLQTRYCINGAGSNLTTPVGSAPNISQPCPILPAPAYSNTNYVYKYYDYSVGYTNLPGFVLGGNTPFNPGNPAFADEIAFDGFVEVSVWYTNLCSGGERFGTYTLVFIDPKPPLAFAPNFVPYGVCASDDPYLMTPNVFDNSNPFDKFWTSPVGNPGGSADGIEELPSGQFEFDPGLANTGSTDILVQINYQHEDASTHCQNSVSSVVNVWAKPGLVPAGDIYIRNPLTADTSGEFCHEEALTPFSVDADPAMVYKWGNVPLSRSEGNGEVYALLASDFANTGGIPNIGAVANYRVSQIAHKVTDIFGFPLFNGCESDPRPLTVTIMQPTAVEAGNDATICQNNPVVLKGPGSVGASITSPTVGLDGEWSVIVTGTNAEGHFEDENHNTIDPPTFSDTWYYYPSGDEITARRARLMLTTDEPDGPCGPESDDVFVTINPSVDISFPVTPVRVCAAEAVSVEGKILGNSSLTFEWSVDTGLGDIAVDTEDDLITTYVPDLAEINFGGTVKLKMETEDPDGPLGPCPVITKFIDVVISQKPLINAGPDFEICVDVPITLNGSINDPLSSASSGTWTENGAGGVVNANALVTQYDPDDVTEDQGELSDPFEKSITFKLTSNTPGGANQCPAEFDEVVVTIHGRPEPPDPATADPPTYCVGTVVQPLKAVGTSITWYNDLPLGPSTQIGSGSNLSTGVLADVEKEVTFYATQTFDRDLPFAGCESSSTPFVITVNPLPVPAFTFENQCLGDFMLLTDGSTVPPNTGNTRTITDRRWDFDDGFDLRLGSGAIADGTHLGRTKGTYSIVEHQFEETGLFVIQLQVVTSDGCSATLTHTPIKVGEIPDAKFSSRLICDEDNTVFRYEGGAPEAGSTFTYAWNFDDAGATSNVKDPTHLFTGVGTYGVQLTVTTDLNCESSITQPTSILPYIKTFPYIEPFESPTHGWVPEGFPQTSWNLVTGTSDISVPGTSPAGPSFWATNTDVAGTITYNNNERSVLYGPCVDMTALERPVVALDYWSETELKADGAYVEVMDESAASPQWVRLGDNASGLNWYNENSIGGLAKANTVGQDLNQFGWSGDTDGWKTGRYNLDNFSNRQRLRFRIVFGSNASQPLNLTEPLDGFAMDYFRLETRNRLVLVENFTSTSTSSVVTNNTTAFKAFPSAAASSEVVKIEYHTGLPVTAGDPVDDIFKQNPMDPNARASFYGLSAVPRGYIDGYTNTVGAGMFSLSPTNWATAYYSTESLVTSPLDIVINTPSIVDGVITITGTVTAREFDLKANQYSIYVAVVEEAVGSDAYVLRKMLPSASGRKVPATLRNGSFTFTETWSIDRAYLSNDPQLITIAFVQSDIVNPGTLKRDVLQAAFNADVPTFEFTTGIEIPFLEQTALYPNPADRLLNIELPKATATGVEVSVIDQVGRPVIKSSIAAGERKTTIDTGGLSGAVYIVQLKENGVFTNRRLVVTHRH